jgi:hypothetical protein
MEMVMFAKKKARKNVVACYLGAAFLAEGLLAATLGRKYVQIFRFGQRRNPYRRMIDWTMGLPPWQLRGAGAAEAALGLAMMLKEHARH